jgi:GDP-mannose 6-dehydrogenase
VGTPAQDDGSISLDEVRSALEEVGVGIGAKASPHVVVLRSTVPPGASQDVAIPLLERFSGRRLGSGLEYQIHPEFLRAGTALADFENPPLILIGERDGASAPVLRQLYSGAKAQIRTTSYKTAEAAKLLSNVFHAVKVTFANEAGAALAGIGLDANEAFDLLCADSVLNISSKYLRPGFAFGGSCLPKDLSAFLHLAERGGVATPFLASLPEANRAVVDRALELINPQPNASIVLFGLAFKPGTDDVRGSPFATLAAELVAKGCKVAIVDPLVRHAWAAGPKGLPAEYRHFAGLLADDVGSALAAAETVILGHATLEDLDVLNAGLRDKFVVDLATYPQLALNPGPAYRGLCW